MAQQRQSDCETNVLVALDSSPISENAFRWYLNTFWRPNHKIHVCHVPEYWGNVQRMISPARLHELIEETNNGTVQLKNKVDQICSASNVSADFEALKGQEPWHEICEYAKKGKVDVIVIGTRGMGALKRTILGSVSDGVLHHCHCPCLIYREN